MGKTRKVLVTLCFAVVAMLVFAILKLPANAMGVDYEDSVVVDYGGDVTLTPDFDLLPSGFQVAKVVWTSEGLTAKQSGNSYKITNVTNGGYAYATVTSKAGAQKIFWYLIRINNNLTVSTVGDSIVIAKAGDTVTLKVKAGCTRGKITYNWTEGYGDESLGTGTSLTRKVSKTTSYTCTVTDQYGNVNSVEFSVYIDETKKLGTKKVYLIGWDDTVNTWKKLVEKAYPEYKNKVESINLEKSGTGGEYYATVINTINKNPDATIIVAMDCSVMDRFIASGKFTDMSKLGLVDAYSQSYPYTRKAATYNKKLMALSPYVSPGTFMYDPDIAKKVLGTSDPDKVQKMIETADGYLSVAAKMKKAGYYMTSGAALSDEYGISGMLYNMSGETPYYAEGTKTYMLSEADKKTAKKIADATVKNGYDTGNDIWSTSWQDDMSSGKVFGWYSCTWAVCYTITFDKPMAVCEGPVSYSWGGTYLAVKSGKKDTVAAQFLKLLCCDSTVMNAMYDSDSSSFPNNAAAVNKIIKAGKNPVSMKGNQNLAEAYDEMARSINGGSYKITKLKVSLTANGIVKGSDGKSYYVKNGLIQTMKSGFVKVGKKTYYIQKGVWKKGKTGFVKSGSKSYYVKKGIRSTKNEFVKVGKKTYYLNKGAKNTKTGLVKVGKTTYYVKKGLKTTKTGIVKKGQKSYYVKKGVWKKNYTGTITYQGQKYSVKKGIVIKKVK